ncbi:MAG: hypothetical protein Q8S20_16925 [Sulfuritalea sp.]|nr:hypothetical protein [Sulfuritalea sp.]
MRQIMRHGDMSAPGVVLCGKIVHGRDVPTRVKAESWLWRSVRLDRLPPAGHKISPFPIWILSRSV